MTRLAPDGTTGTFVFTLFFRISFVKRFGIKGSFVTCR